MSRTNKESLVELKSMLSSTTADLESTERSLEQVNDTLTEAMASKHKVESQVLC